MKISAFLLLLCLCTVSFSQNSMPLAVLELEVGGISNFEGKAITERLRTEIFKTKKFHVMERNKMNDILKEQGFQLSGCTTVDCIVEAGKLIGVQQMVAGNISKIGNLYSINIRLIDVETGRIIKTAIQDCQCSIETVLTKSVKDVAHKLTGIYNEDDNIIYSGHSGINNSPSYFGNIGTTYLTGNIGEFIFDTCHGIRLNSGYLFGIGINYLSKLNYQNMDSFATIYLSSRKFFGNSFYINADIGHISSKGLLLSGGAGLKLNIVQKMGTYFRVNYVRYSDIYHNFTLSAGIGW